MEQGVIEQYLAMYQKNTNRTSGEFFEEFKAEYLPALDFLYQMYLHDRDTLDEAIEYERLMSILPDNIVVPECELETVLDNFICCISPKETPVESQPAFVETDQQGDFELDLSDSALEIEESQQGDFDLELESQDMTEESFVENTNMECLTSLPDTSDDQEQLESAFQVIQNEPTMQETTEVLNTLANTSHTSTTPVVSEQFKSLEKNFLNFQTHTPEVIKNAVVFCYDIQFGTARNQQPYVDFLLRDYNGKESSGKLWNCDDKTLTRLKGKFLLINGEWRNYKNNLSLTVHNGYPIKNFDASKYGVTFKELDYVSEKESASKILQVIQDTKNLEIKKFLDYIFVKKNFIKRYSNVPAGIKYHHSFKYGLLTHTSEVAETANALCQIYAYANPNKDIVMAGALLHDIGKVVEMPQDEDTHYTVEGLKCGHIAIGISLITRFAIECNLPETHLSNLIHLIATHHGKREYGSPIAYNSIESCILHLSDLTSGEVNHIYTNVKDLDHNEANYETRGYNVRL